MPELPEVEAVRQTLKKLVISKKIQDVSVLWPNIVRQPDDKNEFISLLKGQTIIDIHRRGKFLIFELEDVVLVSHLRMEGKYLVMSSSEEKDAYTHILFHFEDGTDLRYRDVRKFGTMEIFPKGLENTLPPLNGLGPEPLGKELTVSYLEHKLRKTSRVIKQVLLDQSVIAGLGNIYVDEVLFQSQIHPTRKASSLTTKEISQLVKAIKDVIQRAIEHGGSTIRTYVNSQGKKGSYQDYLLVYGKKEEPCSRCGHPIEKIKVAQRGTHFCPVCQATQNR
ncbi:DNA-formamidopyrimidine glycosylase [Bacillaceae bacterium S4-13-58]